MSQQWPFDRAEGAVYLRYAIEPMYCHMVLCDDERGRRMSAAPLLEGDAIRAPSRNPVSTDRHRGLHNLHYRRQLPTSPTGPRVQRTLGWIPIAGVEIAAVISLRNLPTMSAMGWPMVFYYALSIFVFMVPCAYVAGELASAYPKSGGIYQWVEEALGERWGFLAIWADWAENVAWFPTVLSFIAAALFYTFDPSLASNRLLLFIVMLGVFWAVTIGNYLGVRVSVLISGIGTWLGNILPGVLLLGLGIAWLAAGRSIDVPFHAHSMLPHANIGSMVFFAGIILAFAGLEMGGFEAGETKDPGKTFPKAIFASTLIIVVLSVLGSMAVMFVVPLKQLNLNAGIMQAFQNYFRAFGVGWLTDPVSFLVFIGGIALLSTWVYGPAKGLFRAAINGDFPHAGWQQHNRKLAPTGVLTIQAVISSILALLFLYEPSVSTSYWILSALTTQLLIIMYALMFLAVLVLRYKQPAVQRPFKIPGGMPGVWLIALLGLAGVTYGFLLDFYPPSQIPTGNPLVYEIIMIGGTLLLSVPPFVIYFLRKPRWTEEGSSVRTKIETAEAGSMGELTGPVDNGGSR